MTKAKTTPVEVCRVGKKINADLNNFRLPFEVRMEMSVALRHRDTLAKGFKKIADSKET